MEPIKQAVILAGGRGTRLGGLTASMPKPMLPVGGVPFLEYQLRYLRRFGVSRVLFCSGYLAGRIEQHFGTGKRMGLAIQYCVEDAPAGTGGALLGARSLLDPVFYALNGDTLFEADLRKLSEALFSGPGEWLSVLALREIEDVHRFGSIRMKGDSIVEFSEKQSAGRGLINGGIYCLRREALEHLPEPPCSLERDLFPKLAQAGRIGGVAGDGYFIDIGLPETLARAQTELPARFGNLANERVEKRGST